MHEDCAKKASCFPEVFEKGASNDGPIYPGRLCVRFGL